MKHKQLKFKKKNKNKTQHGNDSKRNPAGVESFCLVLILKVLQVLGVTFCLTIPGNSDLRTLFSKTF